VSGRCPNPQLFLNPKGVHVPEETAATGLTDNAASGLAYFTFIPAIIFLVAAPYNTNPKIKFHAWQSIFLNCALIGVWIINFILVFIPILGWLISLVLLLGMLVLWVLCIVKAFNGDRFMIPIIGPLAAKQAGIL
jgi:uncharacterized membrane protein